MAFQIVYTNQNTAILRHFSLIATTAESERAVLDSHRSLVLTKDIYAKMIYYYYRNLNKN